MYRVHKLKIVAKDVKLILLTTHRETLLLRNVKNQCMYLGTVNTVLSKESKKLKTISSVGEGRACTISILDILAFNIRVTSL